MDRKGQKKPITAHNQETSGLNTRGKYGEHNFQSFPSQRNAGELPQPVGQIPPNQGENPQPAPLNKRRRQRRQEQHELDQEARHRQELKGKEVELRRRQSQQATGGSYATSGRFAGPLLVLLEHGSVQVNPTRIVAIRQAPRLASPSQPPCLASNLPESPYASPVDPVPRSPEDNCQDLKELCRQMQLMQQQFTGLQQKNSQLQEQLSLQVDLQSQVDSLKAELVELGTQFRDLYNRVNTQTDFREQGQAQLDQIQVRVQTLERVRRSQLIRQNEQRQPNQLQPSHHSQSANDTQPRGLVGALLTSLAGGGVRVNDHHRGVDDGHGCGYH